VSGGAREQNGRVTTLTTPRLVLRPWRPDDLDELAAIYGDPEVMRYIRDGSTQDREQTAASLEKLSAAWAEQGFGLFAVEVRATGVLAGWAGLAVPTFLPEVMPAVEIGWRLGRPFWGYGYATEAARAALRFGFVERDLHRIIRIRHVDNARSGRVMEKLGLRFDRRASDPVNERQLDVFALSREEYLSAGVE
jgi:RimJ/RimL family protein N-acetyltransferase